MCASYVYKRRRLQSSVALLSTPKEAKLSYVLDCYSSDIASTFPPLTLLEDWSKGREKSPNILAGDFQHEHHSSAGLGVQVNGSSNQRFSLKLDAATGLCKTKEKKVSDSHGDNHHNVTSDLNYSVNDSCSSSRSPLEQYSILGKSESEDMGECSSSDVIVLEPPHFISSRDLCMHFLKANEPSDSSSKSLASTIVSSNVLSREVANYCLSCKICGCTESPKNMLICDLCEDAFHLQCCHEKGPFREEWYCKACRSKNPRPLLDAVLGKSFKGIGEEYKRRILQKELGPIRFMLRDTQPYISAVRVGKAFQAVVPEWNTITIEDDDPFGEPMLLNKADCDHLNDLNVSKSSKLNSIGNWLQCRDVVYTNTQKHGSGVICGKWRRAPLFVTQTDNWDCSCAVVWDPIHADCAVPQELETEEILRQLKFIEMVRVRLEKKQICGQTKSEGRR